MNTIYYLDFYKLQQRKYYNKKIKKSKKKNKAV